MAELAHLVGRLHRVEDLVEHHAVDGDHRVVLGDDLLGVHVHHLFHHVLAHADAVDQRHDQMQAGAQSLGIAPEALHRVLLALGHGFDAHEDKRNRENQQNNDENRKG